jgi:VIT1/CCC1 family predicted Fe2+/Mn2+ transporter
MKCEQCGAAIRKGDGRYCSHCGAKLPDVPRVTPDEWVVHPERFDQAEASEAFGSAMSAAAPVAPAAAIVVPLAFLCFWLATGLFIFVAGLAAGSPIFPMFSGVLVTFGAVMILRNVAGSLRFARAPVQRRVSVVIDERVHVSGGGKNSSARTTYYATLSF